MRFQTMRLSQRFHQDQLFNHVKTSEWRWGKSCGEQILPRRNFVVPSSFTLKFDFGTFPCF